MTESPTRMMLRCTAFMFFALKFLSNIIVRIAQKSHQFLRSGCSAYETGTHPWAKKSNAPITVAFTSFNPPSLYFFSVIYYINKSGVDVVFLFFHFFFRFFLRACMYGKAFPVCVEGKLQIGD
jgi:hypothetical protein